MHMYTISMRWKGDPFLFMRDGNKANKFFCKLARFSQEKLKQQQTNTKQMSYKEDTIMGVKLLNSFNSSYSLSAQMFDEFLFQEHSSCSYFAVQFTTNST